MSGNQDSLLAPPKHEALWPTDLFKEGIGWVVIARFKAAGQRVEAGVFLVDVFCLGAKLAVYETCDRQDYLGKRQSGYRVTNCVGSVNQGRE